MTEDDLKRGVKLKRNCTFLLSRRHKQIFCENVHLVILFGKLINQSCGSGCILMKRKISTTSKVLRFKTAKLVDDVGRNS